MGYYFLDSLASAAKSFSGPGFQALQSHVSKGTGPASKGSPAPSSCGMEGPGPGGGVSSTQVLGRWWRAASWLLGPCWAMHAHPIKGGGLGRDMSTGRRMLTEVTGTCLAWRLWGSSGFRDERDSPSILGRWRLFLLRLCKSPMCSPTTRARNGRKKHAGPCGHIPAPSVWAPLYPPT